MCFFLGVGRTPRRLRATLNRVDAVSATDATPTPTKKTPWAHSPVVIPIASPEIPANAAST